MKTADSALAQVFERLVADFPDMIHSVDADGNIVYVNRAGTDLLGYGANELRAMNILQLYPPEIREAVEKGFQEVKQDGEKRVESLLMAKDGTRIPAEMRTLAVHDETGAFARTFTVSRDLRPLKRLQEELIHASRLAAIGELAAGVVHDLNNPLTAILLASTVMNRMAAKADAPPTTLREQASLYCETIREAATAMESLTTRLRDFSRGVKEQHAPVDLFDPIHDALFILSHRIRHGNVKVQCPVVKGRHWILGDRNQIEQVFLNLFANACDALESVPERSLAIEIAPVAEAVPPTWCCTVRDSGGGIPPDVQEQVFRSFFTTKPRGKGTGLGLSISRAIVKEHGGDIRLASETGRGATFSILLPQHEA
jgi:two-component system, NtrC family, sensor kinase